MSLLQTAARVGARVLRCSLPPTARKAVVRPVTFSRFGSPWQAVASRGYASKSETDLGEFLKDEIADEKKNQRSLSLPGSGFEVKQEGAELTFTKSHNDEKIIISLNVNHTVDAEGVPEEGQEAPEMKSQPNFEIDIVKPGGKTLSFSCSFVQPEDQDPEDNVEDAFQIDEVTMFQGEDWTEKCYAVAGDILDGYMYDIFMNMLEERGIQKEFVDKLSDYCSAYEHSLYIKLLEDLKAFAK